MTAMNRKPTRTERAIAKRLNVTTSALDALVRAASVPNGQASGPGSRGGQGARVALRALREKRTDLVEWRKTVESPHDYEYLHDFFITDAGRALVAEARRLGW